MEDALSTHSPQPRVSVVIVSCRRDDLLKKCLEGVAQQTHRDLECFIFLNSAAGSCAEKWKALYPAFSFVAYPDNELYCRPQNEGIKRSSGDFVLCLNDDVCLKDTFIKEALKCFEADGWIGAVSGCVLRDGGSIVDSLGFSWQRSRKPQDRGYGRKVSPDLMQPGYVFGVNGAAAFYRRKMLEEIKMGGQYFDEDYGIYYEDFDLAWRSQRAGWKAFYCPAAVAYHKRGGTTRLKASSKIKFLRKFALASIPEGLKVRHVRNRYATMIKNDTLGPFLMDLPWIFSYEIRLLAYLLFFEPKVLGKVLGDLSFIGNALRKRKKIQWQQEFCIS